VALLETSDLREQLERVARAGRAGRRAAQEAAEALALRAPEAAAELVAHRDPQVALAALARLEVVESLAAAGPPARRAASVRVGLLVVPAPAGPLEVAGSQGPVERPELAAVQEALE
jgi:hypothetical protein